MACSACQKRRQMIAAVARKPAALIRRIIAAPKPVKTK